LPLTVHTMNWSARLNCIATGNICGSTSSDLTVDFIAMFASVASDMRVLFAVSTDGFQAGCVTEIAARDFRLLR